MNCTDCQRTILENGGREHDAALIAHIAACPDCAKVNERTLAISKLLMLKRYEQPAPHAEMRIASAIRKGISEEKPSIFAWNPASLFRPWHAMLAAAACVAVVALALNYSGATKQSGAVAVQQPIEATQPAAVEPINPALAKPLLVVQDPEPGKGANGHTRFGAETNQIKPATFEVPQR